MLLDIYSEENIDISTSDDRLNDFLKNSLSRAYPERFTLKDGVFSVVGDNKASIIDAIGLVDGSLHCALFRPEQFNQLSKDFPKEEGLWQFLRTLTPVSSTFSVENKVDACLEFVALLSRKKVIKTDKTYHALNVLGYASSFLEGKKDEKSLNKIRDILTEDLKQDNEGTVKSWFNRKLSQYASALPKRLLSTIQQDWSMRIIPDTWAKDALGMKQWRENQQQQLIQSSNGLVLSADQNGCQFAFMSLADAQKNPKKNCYVWDGSMLSYIHDDRHVEENIPLEDASRFAVINEKMKPVIEKGILFDKVVKEPTLGGGFQYFSEQDVDYLVTSNSNHQRKKTFDLRAWLLDGGYEKEATVYKTLTTEEQKENETLLGALRYTGRLLFLVDTYYQSEINMLISLEELKAIFESKRAELTEGEQQAVNQCIQNNDALFLLHNTLRSSHPIPGMSASPEAAVEAITNEIESTVYASYMEKMTEVYQHFDIAVNKIEALHPDVLNVRHIIGTSIPLEFRSKDSLLAYAQVPLQRSMRMIEKVSEMLATIGKLSLFSKTLKYDIAPVHSAKKKMQGLMHDFERKQVPITGYQYAKKILDSTLKKEVGLEPQEAATKSMLGLYKVSSNLGNELAPYIHQYLRALLLQACPTVFCEEHDTLTLLAPDRNWRTIATALGQDTYGDADLFLNPKQFNVSQLQDLKSTYPESRAIWSILASLKPIDDSFTAQDKIAVCIDMVSEISKKEIVQTQKLQYALDVLAYAVNEVQAYAKDHPEALAALEPIKALLNPKSLGKGEHEVVRKWMKHKFEERSSSIVVPSVIQALKNEVTPKSVSLLSSVLLTAQKFRQGLLSLNPDTAATEESRSSDSKKHK